MDSDDLDEDDELEMSDVFYEEGKNNNFIYPGYAPDFRLSSQED